MNTRTLLIAASAALMAGPALAQDAAPAAAQPQSPAPQPQGTPWTETPILPGATAAPDCGNLHNLTGRAFCVTAPLGQMEALAESYVNALQGLGWNAADGTNNRVVFIKRTGENQCDAVQMIAFYDTAKPAVAELPAYLGFATIPGNICAPRPVAATPPVQ